MADKVLKLPAVVAKTAVKKTPLYAMIKNGEFPAPIKLGLRAVGWRESQVDAWIASRPNAHANSSINGGSK